MRRASVLVLISACGRFGFAPHADAIAHEDTAVDVLRSDAPQDGMPDGVIDGAISDAMADGAFDALLADASLIDAGSSCDPIAATCADLVLGTALGTNIATGGTAAAGDDFASTCGGAGEPDVVLQWTAPVAGRFTFDTHGSTFDTVLATHQSCAGPVVTCNNDDPVGGTSSALSLDLAACETLLFVIDGTTGAGTYDFSAHLKCPGPDLGMALGTIATGSTDGLGDSYQSTCGGVNVADATYGWAAPSAGRYVFDTRGSAFDTVLALQDSCTGPVVTCNNDDPVGGTSSSITRDLAAGQALVMVVDGATTAGPYHLNAHRKCPGIDAGMTLGTIATASTDGQGDSYKSMCGGTDAPDVEVTWTAPSAGRYVLDTRGSTFDTVLSIQDGCTGPALVCNNDDPAGGTSSSITRDLVAGQVLDLVVDGVTGGGSFQLNARKKCPGVAAGSALGTIATGSIDGAGDSYSSGCGGLSRPDVAVNWTAPTSGRYVFDTRGSTFDTVLAMQDSCTGAPVVCNDDDPAGGSTSAITRDLVAGQNIVFVIDGAVGSSPGTFDLNASRKCPGIDLGSAVGTAIAVGSTAGAGDSYTSSCGGNNAPDVAFTWTAPATAHYHFDTLGSLFDTVLAIHDTCTGPVTSCNNDDPGGGVTSAVDLDLGAGQQIIIVIDGAANSGSYHLNVTQS